ncbi:MAG TPA: DUF2934 domain-containing protein [Burkholderiales bacterium]|jgi:hypothetical protein|nr:DUF2934 domain-containing protein [Burkholderiales bacterium]
MKAAKKPAPPKQAAPAGRKGAQEAPAAPAAAKKRAAPAKRAVKPGASAKPAAPAAVKKAAKPAPAPAAKAEAPPPAAAKKPAKAETPPAAPPAAAKKTVRAASAPAPTVAPATGKNYALPPLKAQPPTPATAAVLTPSPVPQGLDPATLIGTVQGEVPTPPPSAAMQSDPGRAPPTMDEATRRHHIAIEAYLIAESRGFPPHSEHEHWLEAERKLFGKR